MDQKLLAEKEDWELVQMAKENPENFGFLMGRYQEPLFRFIRRIANISSEDAEDILQEVFIKIYQNIYDYDQELKFSSWAYRITRNHTIDHLRKMNVRPKSIFWEDSDVAKFLKSSINIEKEVANKELMRRLEEIIFGLPEKYKEALILRFMEEKDYQEIMDILKKPKGTVATLIDRGKKMLAEEIKRQKLI